MAESSSTTNSTMQRFLNAVERAGNMVPHPVVIFLILIGLVMVFSAVLGHFGTSATLERIDPDTNKIVKSTTTVRSLLDRDGIRFLYESLILNFMAFTAVGLLIAVMIGAGVMEESGLVWCANDYRLLRTNKDAPACPPSTLRKRATILLRIDWHSWRNGALLSVFRAAEARFGILPCRPHCQAGPRWCGG